MVDASKNEVTWFVCSRHDSKQSRRCAGAERKNSKHRIPSGANHGSSLGTLIGAQDGCSSGTPQHCGTEPLTDLKCSIIFHEPTFLDRIYFQSEWFLSSLNHYTYLGCNVDVKSWSMNCPHCASINVTGESLSFDPCTKRLMNRGEGNGPPKVDCRNSSIESA